MLPLELPTFIPPEAWRIDILVCDRGSVMSRNLSVIPAAVFAVLLLGVVQLGRAQSTSTAAGDVPAVKELYGMKLVRADTAAREVWSNSNGYFVTAVWE